MVTGAFGVCLSGFGTPLFFGTEFGAVGRFAMATPYLLPILPARLREKKKRKRRKDTWCPNGVLTPKDLPLGGKNRLRYEISTGNF